MSSYKNAPTYEAFWEWYKTCDQIVSRKLASVSKTCLTRLGGTITRMTSRRAKPSSVPKKMHGMTT